MKNVFCGLRFGFFVKSGSVICILFKNHYICGRETNKTEQNMCVVTRIPKNMAQMYNLCIANEVLRRSTYIRVAIV